MAVDDPGRYSGRGVPTAATPEVHTTHIHRRAAISQSEVLIPLISSATPPKTDHISEPCGDPVNPRCARLTSICMEDHLSLNLSSSPDSTENSLVERVQDIYLAVVESEECMERVACEVGGIAADAGINKGMTK